MKKSLFWVLCVWFCLFSCKTTKNRKANNSVLHFEPSSIPMDENSLMLLYTKHSDFSDYAMGLINQADAYTAKAQQLMLKSSVSSASGASVQLNAAQTCLVMNANAGSCQSVDGFPKDVIVSTRRALVNLYKVIHLFDIPIVNRNLIPEQKFVYNAIVESEAKLLAGSYDLVTQYDELPASGDVIRLPSGTEEKVRIEWWDSALDAECGGTMTQNLQQLCRETLIATSLIDFADQQLYIYSSDPEARKTQGEALLNRYIRFFTMGNARLSQLRSVYNQAFQRVMAIQEGVLSAQDVNNIPVLAVVAEPQEISTRVRFYADGLTGSGKALDRYRSANSKILEIDRLTLGNEADILNRLKELETINNDQSISKLRNETIEEELKLLNDRLERQKAQLEKSSKKFVVEFDSIFGKYSPEIRRVQNEPAYLNFEHGKGESAAFPIGPNVGAIAVNVVGSPKIVANGIYANGNMPKPAAQFGWLKKAAKKASKGLSKAASGVKNMSINSLKSDLGSAWDRNKSWLGPAVMGGGLGFGMGIPGLDGLLPGLPGLGGLGDLLGGGGGIDAAMGEFGKVAGKALNPLTTAGFSALDQVIKVPNLSPTTLLETLKAEGDKLGFPPMDTHVYKQTTNLDGYIISESIGKGYSIGNGKSFSRSASVGLTAGVVFVSGNASVNTSVSDSASSGISTNSGQNLQLGFYGKAEAAALRVGMLTARLQCPSGVRYVGVGVANTIILAGELAGCTSVTFFVNDDKEGAKRNECDGERCGRGDAITLEVNPYMDSQKIFQAAVGIINDPGFIELVNTASASSDPVGSVWRVFEATAKKQGLALTDPFKPIIEQLVANARDELALKQTSLEMTKLQTEADIIVLNRDQATRNIEIAKDLIAKGNKGADLLAVMRSIASLEADIYEDVSRFYIDRAKFWLDLYQRSAAYHDPDVRVDDFAMLAYQYLLDIENDELKSKLLSMNTAIFEIMSANIQDREFIKGILDQSRLGHCMIDFADIGFKGPETLATVKLNAMNGREQEATNGAAAIRYYRLPEMAGRTVGVSETASDTGRSIASYAAKEFVKMEGYYEVTLRVDPTHFIKTYDPAINTESLTSPGEKVNTLNPLLRCTGSDLGKAKVIGANVTFYTKKIGADYAQPPEARIHISRDPLMKAYISQINKWLYYFIDFASLPEFYQRKINPSPTRAIPLGSLVNITAATNPLCINPDRTYSFNTVECMKKLLGDSLPGGEAAALEKTVSNVYFNSYMGGTWRLYIPDDPLWTPYTSRLMQMQLNLFVKYTDTRF